MLAMHRFVIFLIFAVSWVSCVISVKPLCRDRNELWRECRIQIGGLAIQGADAFIQALGPTFQEYLTNTYNDTYGLEFEVLPLNFDQNFEMVSAGQVDFIYSNPAAYTCMAVEFEVQTVASLINFRKGFALGKFAGVIFARADSDFRSLEDLRRARVEAVSLSGLGAMQLQQAELLSQGLDIMTDVPRLTFAFNQNKIVQDVQNGLADVGFVRTDLIDRNVAANTTSWDYFRVIGEIVDDNFPFAHSTSFTPEWPIGGLKHVPDEIRELLGRALMSLDRDSNDPTLSEPAIKGNFASWTTPSNYLGLLDMLQRIRYLDPVARRCLRSSDEYNAIFCPPGWVKKSREQVFCPDCREGYSCLCSPCAKLRDPEYVLQAEMMQTNWKGNVDVETLENRTFLAESCERLTVCGHVFAGQKLRWKLLDQIGADTRLAINAPQIATVELRMTIDGPSQATTVQNVTTSELATQLYSLEYEPQGRGTQVIQININGQPASMSPVVLEVEAPPLREFTCPMGHAANQEGQCIPCLPGTSSPGGTSQCRTCDPGTHQPLEGQGSCESCPVGHYQANSGSVSCTPCDAGSSSRGQTGAFACSLCEPGQEAPRNGSQRCTPCKRGHYSENEGAATCLQCTGGKSTAEQGATDPSLCICLDGKRLGFMNGEEQCILCGNGLNCSFGNDDPQQLAGFWVDFDREKNILSVYRCRNELECPAGILGSCASGRASRACNNCKSWHKPDKNGTCDACVGVDSLPLLWFFLGTLVLSGLTWLFAQTSLARQRLGQVTVFLTAGQVIMLMQLMAALKNLDFQWTGPALHLLEALGVLAFDIDFLNLGCVLPDAGPSITFLSQLMAYPAFSLCMFVVWWCIGRWGGGLKREELFNINGLVLMTLYVTLTIVSLLPWQCISNPNGTLTMQTQPGVICFNSEEHTTLMFLSILGMLMYPVPMLAVSIQATVMYPSYVAGGQGLIIVNRYRFIFERFRATRYFFGVLYLCRNTLLSLIPVVFANYPSIQVTMLAAVMLLGMIIQMRAWPWRTKVANITDMMFSSSVVLFLVIAGPILSFETEADRQSYAAFLSWTFCALLLLFLLAFFWVALLYLRRRVNPVKPYKIFLTHQKGAAGSLARFIKYILNKYSGDGVFLDSDELQDLDSLFECVRAHTSFVVPLLTPGLLTRPWCVGELATAFLNRVPILPISCNKATLIPSARIAGIVHGWTADQFQPLLAAGIDVDSIEATVEFMAGLKAIEYDRSLEFEQQERVILRIVEHCGLKRRHFVDVNSKPDRDAEILILTNTGEYEAMASSMILQLQLQQQVQEMVLVPKTVNQMVAALPRARVLIILLHHGILYDVAFAGMILAAHAQGDESQDISLTVGKTMSNNSDGLAWNRILTVSADTSFVFPGHEVYTSISAQGISAEIGPEFGQRLCDAYRIIFKKISLPFSSLGSSSLIEHQVKEIGKRVQGLRENMGGVTVTRSNTGRRISTRSAEGVGSFALATLDFLRSPESSVLMSPSSPARLALENDLDDLEPVESYPEDEETGRVTDSRDFLMPTDPTDSNDATEWSTLPKVSDMVHRSF